MPSAATFADQIASSEPLRFLWLELTNRCNLECVHCYADFGPQPERKDILKTDDYKRVIAEAASLGCRSIQFIGGEPTLNKALPDLIDDARSSNFDFVEVYTNGTNLPDFLLRCFKDNDVKVAVSLYADNPEVHDAITTRNGSHQRTVRNMRRMIDAGLDVRVGVISMDANKQHVDDAVSFARKLGIENVGVDHARGVGRGTDIAPGSLGMQSLCGACWQGSACVAPDGSVSPCIMSKAWPVGSVVDTPLSEIVSGSQLHSARERIYSAVWLPKHEQEMSSADECNPKCQPNCQPVCNPCLPLCKPTCVPSSRP